MYFHLAGIFYFFIFFSFKIHARDDYQIFQLFHSSEAHFPKDQVLPYCEEGRHDYDHVLSRSFDKNNERKC
jgi:hypothetical protein